MPEPFRPGVRRPGFRSDLQRGDATDPVKPLVTFAHNVYVAKHESILALGLLLVRQAKAELVTPGRGRTYEKYDPRRTHVASAPGDPPATDLGDLLRSVDMEVEGWARVRVGSAHHTADKLELGTLLTGGRIAPRPWLRTALAKVQAMWGREIVTRLKRAVPRG